MTRSETIGVDATFRVALIGMSNIGKSLLAHELSKATGVPVYSVDCIIQKRLGLANMGALTHWLGSPLSEGFKQREHRYLELEEEITAAAPVSGPLILDTTGSVAHLPELARSRLRRDFFVIHLKPQAEVKSILIDQFLKIPKPLIWDGGFSRGAGEGFQQALKLSYPTLLKRREQIYDAVAHTSLYVKRTRRALADNVAACVGLWRSASCQDVQRENDR